LKAFVLDASTALGWTLDRRVTARASRARGEKVSGEKGRKGEGEKVSGTFSFQGKER
jgi:hypothetical protein